VQSKTPLGALAFNNQLQVYWRKPSGGIFFSSKKTGDAKWKNPKTTEAGPGDKLTVLGWDGGKQNDNGVIHEQRSHDGGENWEAD